MMFIMNTFIGSIEYLSKKADYYTNLQEKDINIASLFFVGLVKRFIIIGVILLLRNRLFNDENFVYYFNLYLIGFVIYAGTYMISPDFGVRFSSYYTIMDTILVGNIIFLVKSKPIKIAVLLLFCGLSIYKVSTYAIVPTYEYRSIL
jgi:nitrate reductase gamma subunit